MKKVLLFLLFLPCWLAAQNDAAYLEGAVPLVDGKVIFQKELSTNTLTPEQLFQAMQTWMHERFGREGCRVVYENEAEGHLAAIGEEYIEFSRSALALDRSRMLYQVTAECEGNTCVLQFKNIRYKYDVAYQREPEEYDAEEWIIDKYALHKGKLNRISGKFRRETIDFANELFAGASAALGITAQPVPSVAPAEAEKPVQKEEPAVREKAGYKAFTASQLPEIMKSMLAESACSVARGTETLIPAGQAAWKGIGTMFGKDIASFAVANSDQAAGTLRDNDTYTLSFYKSAGDKEPWLMMECKKSGTSAEGEQTVIAGEILRIWVK